MKNYLIAILFTGLVFNLGSAQNFNMGVKGGLNVYNITTANVDNDPLTNFHLGLLGHIHLARQLAIQPELVYSTQGATSKSGAEIKLGYLNIPVLFQYMFDNGFRLQLGPQVGLLTRAKSTLNGAKTDIKNNFKGIDLSLSPGVGYVHPPSGFGVDLRYNFGLSNINKSDAVVSKNNGLQLGVFYLFDHK